MFMMMVLMNRYVDLLLHFHVLHHRYRYVFHHRYWNVLDNWYFFDDFYFLHNWYMYWYMDFGDVMVVDGMYFVWYVDGNVFMIVMATGGWGSDDNGGQEGDKSEFRVHLAELAGLILYYT